MAQYIIPTVFTATDKLSRPVNAMTEAVRGLGQAGRVASAGLNSVGNILGEDVHQRLKFLVSLGKSMAILAVATTAAKSLLDYDTALTQFRIIVSDLNNADFSKFKKTSTEIANATKASSTEVLQMFTNIASFDDRLAATPEKLKGVTEAAITLQRAGFMTADAAAKSLVTTLSQFNYDASESNRVINAMAAGQNRGAYSINQTAEALVGFGATAKAANFQIEDAIGFLQALAKTGMGAAEAGTAINAVITRIQQSGAGYKTGHFNAIEGLETMKARLDKMTEKARNSAITDIFGIHRLTEGQRFLNNISDIKYFTDTAKGTQEATKAADIAMSSLGSRLQQVANTFITYVTTAGEGESITTKLGNAAKFLSDNMNTILNVAVPIIKVMLVLKAVTVAAALATAEYTGILKVYNFIAGWAAVKTGTLSGALLENAAATKGAEFALGGYNRTLAAIGLTAATVLTTILALNEQMDKEGTLKKLNPLNLNFSKGVEDNREKLNKFHISDSQYQKWQAIYNQKQMDLYGGGGPIGEFIVNRLKGRVPTTEPQGYKLNVDSARNSADFLMRHAMDTRADTFGGPVNKPDTSGVPLPTGQPTTSVVQPEIHLNVQVTQDKSGQWATTLESKSASGVPVKVKQTGGPARTV